MIELRAQGIERLAFPMPVRRSNDLAGERHDGSGTIDHRLFHGFHREWTHCILPNATWNFSSSIAPVPVFNTAAVKKITTFLANSSKQRALPF